MLQSRMQIWSCSVRVSTNLGCLLFRTLTIVKMFLISKLGKIIEPHPVENRPKGQLTMNIFYRKVFLQQKMIMILQRPDRADSLSF